MTLNIILGSKAAIHLSSDYCLIDPRTGKTIKNNGAKQISYQNFDWSLQIAFAGIAYIQNYNTREWILGFLKSYKANTSLSEFVSEMAREGTQAIRNVPSPYRLLTVSIVGQSNNRLVAFLISNIDHPDGQKSDMPSSELSVFQLNLSKPNVWITGQSNAVARIERNRLRHALKKKWDYRDIQKMLSKVNRQASKRPRLGDSISPECYVYTFFPDGSGSGTNFGEVEGIPNSVLLGMDLNELFTKYVKPAKGEKLRITGMTSVRSFQTFEDCNTAIRVNPDNWSAYDNRGRLYYESGQYDRALDDYNKAIQLSGGENNSPFNNRGNLFRKQKKYQDALDDYNIAIKINPDDPLAYNNRGVLFQDIKKFSQALQDYSKAIALSPRYGQAYNNRACLYVDMENRSLALLDFNKAVEIDPKKIVWRYNRATSVYINQKDYVKAQDDYNEILSIDPNHVDSLVNLGFIYHSDKNFEKAKVSYEKAISLQPGAFTAYYNLACLYAVKGDLDVAMHNLRVAVELEQASGSAKLILLARSDPDLAKLHRLDDFHSLLKGEHKDSI